MEINQLLNLYRPFTEKLQALDRLSVGCEVVKPAAPADLQRLEQMLNIKLPDYLKQFWLGYDRELKGDNGAYDKTFFSVGFDFYSPAYLERDLNEFRGIASYHPEGSFEHELHSNGIPLSFSEPQLACDLRDGRIFLVIYDGETPHFPVAASFAEFFEHYLAAGCFCSHNFAECWNRVGPIAPLQIPPEHNKWVQFSSIVYG